MPDHHARNSKCSSSRRNGIKVTKVGSTSSPASHYAISISHLFFYSECHIRKSRSGTCHISFRAFWPHFNTIEEKVRCKNLISYSGISLVPALCKPASRQCLIFFYRHPQYPLS